jgi:hypothetical protein
MRSFIALACIVACANAGAVSLNLENFDELVTKSGKNAFVKFQAPW